MAALLPARGAGLDLDELRAAGAARGTAAAGGAGRTPGGGGGELSDLIGQRYFAHAGADATHSI